MEVRNDVADKMDKIRTIFQRITELSSEQPDDALLIIELEKTDSEFRSIAYEAAAMVRAENGFSKGNVLAKWTAFAVRSIPHAVQVHVGLGWAISKRKVDTSTLIGAIDPFMLPRVLDGSGYCDALFRQRVTIQSKILPEHISDSLLRGYDQGVGRALWYISKGNPNEVTKLVNGFPASRQTDLWRGIGIAVTYVGGNNREALELLCIHAGIHLNALATGCVLATLSRAQASTLNNDTALASNVLCGLSSSDAVELASIGRLSGSDYFSWIAKIGEKQGKRD